MGAVRLLAVVGSVIHSGGLAVTFPADATKIGAGGTLTVTVTPVARRTTTQGAAYRRQLDRCPTRRPATSAS